MPTTMKTPPLVLVDSTTPGCQKVAVLEEVGRIAMRYAEVPVPGVDEVRVRITYVGICGSDLESFRGLRAPEFMTTPARLGHEVAGVIDAVGSSVVGVRVGDRVTCRYGERVSVAS